MDWSEAILEGPFLVIGPFMGGYQTPISRSIGQNMVFGRTRNLKRFRSREEISGQKNSRTAQGRDMVHTRKRPLDVRV